ncbi:hypothetical protein D1816_22970 [Aquimarina sp. AD10]|nr:hypothetical protein D1816_22970 [Aquimarina sp. AD10]RKM96887.1 hypothetical protein D7033_15345 [Aquimarina sp. AD10]
MEMKKRVLFITLLVLNLGLNAQTKIGFNINDAFDVSGNSVAHYGMSRISGTGYHYVGLSGYFGLNFYTEGKERIKISRNGNVGIGTSNPKSKFHLYRGISGGNPHGFSALTVEGSDHSMISILTPNNKTAYFGFSDAEDDYVGGMQYEHSTNRLVFRTNNHGSDLIINNNGNVGIGTSNSEWKLAVNGKIRAKEIKVETGWSDFVFFRDYKLPTLQEVESHIKENGHLKDIPSAKEVEKNGIYLGEMDSKLLQKIEELTLYTIQQQKEIESLKKENKEVKLLNKKLLELQSRLEKLESEK